MFYFLDRGVLMDEAGAGDAGGGIAVADPSSDFGADAISDTSDSGDTDGEVHDAEFVEPAVEGEPPKVEETAVVKAGERPVMGGKLTATGKAAVEAVRAINPGLAQRVTQALLTRDYFMQQFPGGKAEVVALKALAEQHGGQDGIAELRSIADQMTELDRRYAESDPTYLDLITSTPEGQQSFVGLMPHALQKFAKLDPERFAYHNAVNFAGLMDQARLPVTCARMADLLNRATSYQKAGNHEMASSLFTEVTQTYNEIAQVLGKVYEASEKTPPAPGSAKDPALEDKAKQLTLKEQALQKQEWEGLVTGERRKVFSKAWDTELKGRTLTKDQQDNIKGFYELRMTAKLKNWQNQAERFHKNGDKDGYLREQFGFFQKAIPEALRQAVQQAAPGKPGPKPAAGPVKPPINGTPPQNGAQRVQNMPPTSELDVVRTTEAMLRENKAYRKDGSIVQWA